MEEKMMQYMQFIAKRLMEKTGECPNIMVVFMRNGQAMLSHVPLYTPEDKRRLATDCALIASHPDVAAIGQVTEAWTTFHVELADAGSAAEIRRRMRGLPSPSKSPDRVEVVCATVTTPGGTETSLAKITRDEFGAPTLGDFDVAGDRDLASGLFTNHFMKAQAARGEAN